MIYEKNNTYYIKKGSSFYIVDILIKEHTIVIMPTSKYITILENARKCTYNELKNKFIN